MERLRDEFSALVAPGDRADLARGALTIARISYPGLALEPSLARLDRLAAGARPRLAPDMPPEDAAVALGTYLFRECGFRGNQGDYYDPRNSFLNDVLERRTGIPISLAVVMIETGARLGLRVEGVGFPGHFLVRVAGSQGRVHLDPFFGGRVVGEEELLGRLRALQGKEGPKLDAIPPEVLDVASTPGILTRMLRNLVHIYLEREDHAHALEAVDLLSVVAPSAELLRVRGLLWERLECFAAALEDLGRYLEVAPEAPDADDIRERVTRLARAAATIQ
jgi:regulator of sirC expression with transglutaminase-like and TPR domain